MERHSQCLKSDPDIRERCNQHFRTRGFTARIRFTCRNYLIVFLRPSQVILGLRLVILSDAQVFGRYCCRGDVLSRRKVRSRLEAF